MALGDRGFYLKNVKFASSSHANRFLFLSLKNCISWQPLQVFPLQPPFCFLLLWMIFFYHKFFLLASRKIVLRTLRIVITLQKLWSKLEASVKQTQTWSKNIKTFWYPCFTSCVCFTLASLASHAITQCLRLLPLLRLLLLLLHKRNFVAFIRKHLMLWQDDTFICYTKI